MLITLAGSNGEISVNISEYWSDQFGIAIKGWISAAHGPPDDLEFVCDNAVVRVAAWHAREDLVSKKPQGFLGKAWGFWCYLPSTSTPSVTIQRRGSKARERRHIQLTRHPPKIPDRPKTESGSLFDQFRAEVNRAPGKILEIGSRQVVAGGQSKRGLFPDSRYVGFDYYPDANTDVVGDAHELSKFFGCEFDAVFSLAVFEHFAMPWVVAAEINKVLKVDGLTFHSTHFAFPPHETPWDFWRYTDHALRVLFSPPLGFEMVGCAFDTPVHLHPDTVREDLIHLPAGDGLGGHQCARTKDSGHRSRKIRLVGLGRGLPRARVAVSGSGARDWRLSHAARSRFLTARRLPVERVRFRRAAAVRPGR